MIVIYISSLNFFCPLNEIKICIVSKLWDHSVSLNIWKASLLLMSYPPSSKSELLWRERLRSCCQNSLSFFHFKFWNTKIPFFANWVLIKLIINWLDHINESDDWPVTKGGQNHIHIIVISTFIIARNTQCMFPLLTCQKCNKYWNHNCSAQILICVLINSLRRKRAINK